MIACVSHGPRGSTSYGQDTHKLPACIRCSRLRMVGSRLVAVGLGACAHAVSGWLALLDMLEPLFVAAGVSVLSCQPP